MGLYRPTTRISGTAAAGANFAIPAVPGRLTLLIGTDAVGRFAVSAGTAHSVANFIGGGQANSPNLYLDNVKIGTLIEGAFTVNNAHTGTMTFSATWTVGSQP